MAEAKKLINTNVYWLWISLVIIVLDQLTKGAIRQEFALYDLREITSWFNLTRLHNTGAAFSFLADAGGWQQWFFIILGVVVSLAVMVWLRLVPKDNYMLCIGLCLVIGGALGNVIDRVALGYVVDFLDFHIGEYHWPAFNIADIAIVTGAALLILDSFRAVPEEEGK
ncbi:MAG: signal peptidase II [Gammaproteobacteria bacterium]|nr:signal peptidase II [Gammaproteobacteria bacterium]